MRPNLQVRDALKSLLSVGEEQERYLVEIHQPINQRLEVWDRLITPFHPSPGLDEEQRLVQEKVGREVINDLVPRSTGSLGARGGKRMSASES